MIYTSDYIAPNRDRALIELGRFTVAPWPISEGYIPAYEGEERYRGLAYVGLDGIRVCYKEKV